MKIRNFLVKTLNQKDIKGVILNVEACICFHRQLLYLTFDYCKHDNVKEYRRRFWIQQNPLIGEVKAR